MKLEILEYVAESQEKRPPLLFVHGGSHGAWCWKEHFLPYFAEKGFSSYALSFRGHGESEGRENLSSLSLADYAEDVFQVLQKIPEKPVLLGHSLGGSVVQKVWFEHPDALRAIVLLSSPPPTGMLKEWMKIAPPRFRMLYKLNMYNRGKRVTTAEKVIERILFPFSAPTGQNPIFPAKVAERLFLPRGLSPEKKRAYLEQLQPESLVAAEGMIRQELNPSAVDREMPLFILGSEKDAFFSKKLAFLTADAYQKQATILPDLCHDMMLDLKWRLAADAIAAFLQESVVPLQSVPSQETASGSDRGAS